MATFLSLPLELRNQIYGYVLSDGHDIIHNGLPSLYKVHPEITREIYSYRDFVIAILVHHDPPTADEPPPLLQTRLHNLINKFNAKFQEKKSLIVLLVAVAETRTFADYPGCRCIETHSDKERSTCADYRINSYNLSTTMKAMQWATELMAVDIDARLDRRTVRTRRDPPFVEPPQGVDDHGMVWY